MTVIPSWAPGQLERKLAQAPIDLGGPPIAFRGEPLHPTAIYGDESELAGDEEGSEKNEDRNG